MVSIRAPATVNKCNFFKGFIAAIGGNMSCLYRGTRCEGRVAITGTFDCNQNATYIKTWANCFIIYDNGGATCTEYNNTSTSAGYDIQLNLTVF